MPDLNFLDSKHAIYEAHATAWARDERRLVGGDTVLEELIQFAAEETDSYDARLKWARWLGFGKAHTSLLAGHLRRGTPIPDFGELGEVRERSEVSGNPSLAELFYYNCDGVGNDGSQLPAYMDGVQQRALATGFRWLMVEMPSAGTLEAIRLRLGRETAEGQQAPATTEEDVHNGFRPFLVEYSPLAVTNWRFRDGVLVWVVIRIPVEAKNDLEDAAEGEGYYLLVRKGYRGLGDDYKVGGWWKYDSQKTQLDSGPWADTDGQIPLWIHMGEPGQGTYARPSIGQSATMELGQISADLMNAVSEQRFNARQAAKSINYFLGIDPTAHAAVISQQGDMSISVGVPSSRNPDGTYTVPTMWNSSEGALATEVYKTIIDSAMAEAKEIMVRQVTAGPDASGARVEADHAQHTSPLLARIAATAETSWNTMLYFVARRFGIPRPTASVTLPREYELRNVLDSIDQMLLTFKDNGLESPTWKRLLLQRKGDELDLLPAEEREQIEGELEEIGDETQRLTLSKLRAEVAKAWMDAGASEEGAAKEAGLEPGEIVALGFGQEPEPVLVPGSPVPLDDVSRETTTDQRPMEEAA